jgi:hypothetical protein
MKITVLSLAIGFAAIVPASAQTIAPRTATKATAIHTILWPPPIFESTLGHFSSSTPTGRPRPIRHMTEGRSVGFLVHRACRKSSGGDFSAHFSHPFPRR